MALFNLRFTSPGQQMLIICAGTGLLLARLAMLGPEYPAQASNGFEAWLADACLFLINSLLLGLSCFMLLMTYQSLRVIITGHAGTRVIECLLGFAATTAALLVADRMTYDVWGAVVTEIGPSWQMFPLYYAQAIFLETMLQAVLYMAIMLPILFAATLRMGIREFQLHRATK